MSLADTTLTSAEQKRLDDFITQGLNITQEVDDLKGALKDLAKTVGDELNVKPKVLMKALRAAYKQTLADDKEVIADVEEILVLTKRA